MARTRIKFCGFTRVDDVDVAVGLGVDAIGFNLAKGPRRIGIDQAALLAHRCPAYVTPVLLTVDADVHQVLELLLATRCTAVQLHGDEPPEVAAELRRRVPVCKAIAVSSAADLARMRSYPADSFLLDHRAPPGVHGGTGVAWDWSLLHGVTFAVPVILAGGLHADNVGAGIAAVHPWAIDVASGIESSPGVKDAARMAAVVAAVCQADRQADRQAEAQADAGRRPEQSGR